MKSYKLYFVKVGMAWNRHLTTRWSDVEPMFPRWSHEQSYIGPMWIVDVGPKNWMWTINIVPTSRGPNISMLHGTILRGRCDFEPATSRSIAGHSTTSPTVFVFTGNDSIAHRDSIFGIDNYQQGDFLLLFTVLLMMYWEISSCL